MEKLNFHIHNCEILHFQGETIYPKKYFSRRHIYPRQVCNLCFKYERSKLSNYINIHISQ